MYDMDIGNRIRTLRRQKGLTQSQLAGDELTKSMMSQIENGRALPSMKTLNYIAEKLGCEPGYFLESDRDDFISLVRKTERALNEKKYMAVYHELKPFMSEKLPATVNTARLLEQFAIACMHQEQPEAKEALNKAISIYERHSLYRESAQAQLAFKIQLFKQNKFTEHLQLINDVRGYYAEKQIENDILFELKLLYDEAISMLALGHYQEGKDILLRAITLSKEKHTYYKADEFYRIVAYQAVLQGNIEEYQEFIKKAQQYATFTESNFSLALIEMMQAFYYNSFCKDYKKSLHHVEAYRQYTTELSELYYLEKGKALFGLQQYTEALKMLNQVNIPKQLFHPLDRAMIYTSGVYKALCYARLGEKEKSIQEAEQAYTNIKSLPDSYYYKFASETLVSLYKQFGKSASTLD
ncbi:helix-turn-helix domain-containing protein [Ectobacillus antri]|jgi:transcriptional regulator with XRE-family HTH domain